MASSSSTTATAAAFDRRRYEAVLDACALRADLETFAGGDETGSFTVARRVLAEVVELSLSFLHSLPQLLAIVACLCRAVSDSASRLRVQRAFFTPSPWSVFILLCLITVLSYAQSDLIVLDDPLSAVDPGGEFVG